MSGAGRRRADERYGTRRLSRPEWLEELPREERFDAVVSRLAIHHLPDERKRELYEEVFDLLVPDGIFLNWDHVAIGGLAEGMFDECFVERMLEAERQRDNPRPTAEVMRSYNDAHDDDDVLLDPETQCRWLREIGFEDAEVYFKVVELAIIAGVRPKEDV